MAAAFLAFPSRNPGAVPQPTAAISVNLETTDVLDAIEQSLADTTSAAAAGSPGETAEAEQEEAEPPAEREDAERQRLAEDAERQRLAEEALRKAEAEREQREAEERARAEERRQAEENRRREEEARAEAERAEARRRAAQRVREARERAAKAAASQAGGASGSRGAQASAGRVSASTGAFRNYGAIVRARIARNKPPGGGVGRVVIALAISTSGSLQSARIVRSSGSPSLDQSALSAVRRASPFPPPPKGASPGQLRFTIPFQFR